MTLLSRRQFLEGSTALAASIAPFRLLTLSVVHAEQSGLGATPEGWQYMRMPLAGPWEAWSAPAKLALRVTGTTIGRTTVEATLLDASGVACLDARNIVRFKLTGEGKLIDNGGTSSTSRVVQLQNGRAKIAVELRKSTATIGVTSDGVMPALCSLQSAK
jgi:hypothetical protein